MKGSPGNARSHPTPPAQNKVYSEFFPPEAAPPARACFAVRDLPAGAKVEIEATAAVGAAAAKL